MTDMTNIHRKRQNLYPRTVGNASFQVEETYWGYTVSSSKGPGIGIIVAQTLCMFFGASLMAGALGLWIVPATLFGAEVALMRVGTSILFIGVATLLLWFASRGTQSELQIDCNLGEVREVIRNRTGNTTLLGRYGFDSIGGVFLDRRARNGQVALVMRYRNTAQTMTVATGSERDLLTLRDRLGRDLMVASAAA